jgi:TusA-related sulfurtransferase
MLQLLKHLWRIIMSDYSFSSDEEYNDDQLHTNFVSSRNNKHSKHEGQTNNGLTEYEKVLVKLENLFNKVTQRTDQLSAKEQQAEQKQINDLFAQVITNLNADETTQRKETLINQENLSGIIKLAAYFGNTKTITVLLEKHQEALIKDEAEALTFAIMYAAHQDKTETLNLLLNNLAVMETVINQDAKVLAKYITDTAENGPEKALRVLLNNDAIFNKVLSQCPRKLVDAITSTVNNDQKEAYGYSNCKQNLELLLSKDVLEKIRYYSPDSKTAFDDIVEVLKYYKDNKYFNVMSSSFYGKGVSSNVEESVVKVIATETLATIDEIEQYPEVLKEIETLSTQEQPDKTAIDKKFEEARKLVTNNNINYEHSEKNLMELSIDFNNTDTIKHLLENHFDKLKEKPIDLGYSIEYSASKGHIEALTTLLTTRGVLDTVINKCPGKLVNAIEAAAQAEKTKVLELLLSNDKIINAIIKDSGKDNLKDALDQGFEGNKDKVADIIATRNQIVLKRNITTGIGAGIAGSAVGLGTIAGAFTAKLLASKSTTVKNCISLVVNCFLPIFNATNNLLMKISPKLDLNNLAKALSNPIVTGLIVGVIAIVGAITSSIVAGVGAHKKQGGTILGR